MWDATDPAGRWHRAPGRNALTQPVIRFTAEARQSAHALRCAGSRRRPILEPPEGLGVRRACSHSLAVAPGE
jgi:hypothetical protein